MSRQGTGWRADWAGVRGGLIGLIGVLAEILFAGKVDQIDIGVIYFLTQTDETVAI